MSDEERAFLNEGVFDEEKLPKDCLAIVFAPDGSRFLLLPEITDETEVVPDHILAGTEALFMLTNFSNDDLAGAFRQRAAEDDDDDEETQH